MECTIDHIFSLKGKTAFITGGYRGIGLAIAEIYAVAGAKLVIASRNGDACRETAAKIGAQYGVDAAGMRLDVCDAKQVDETVAAVMAKFGRIDILVNNAGIDSSQKLFFKMSDDEVNRVMDTNFTGTFRVSRAVAGEMIKQKSGKIINVASMGGKVAIAGMSEYCASKAAVIQLSRVMAVELARYGIQVNSLCPGFFHTEMTAGHFSNPDVVGALSRNTPVKRIGNVDELKTTALYLATCPSFVTGTEIYADGGFSVI